MGFQTAVGYEDKLASSSTLSRFENKADRKLAVNMNKQFVEAFISSFKSEPKELILDFDPTDDPVHGHQEKGFIMDTMGHTVICLYMFFVMIIYW